MLALFPHNMNDVLKYAIIAFAIVLAAVLVPVCFDGAGAACGHACCAGAARGRRIQRLIRRLRAACTSAIGLVVLLCGAARQSAAAIFSWASPQVLARVSALRI